MSLKCVNAMGAANKFDYYEIFRDSLVVWLHSEVIHAGAEVLPSDISDALIQLARIIT